jgi:anaerobic selenocysteine-containing dehydrogenase
MFPEPAVDLLTVPRGFSVGRGHFGRWRSEVRGLPEFGGELPAATLAEEVLDAGDRRMRALITNAGNPVISAPNGRRVAEALDSLEFMVSVDFYLNATTRHADLILPPVSPLERSHYDLVFHLFAVRDTVKYSPPLFEPAPDARHDWQIWAALNDRLQRARGTDWRTRLMTKAINRLGPDRIIDFGLRYGPQGGLVGGLSLGRLADEPHGIDLGPLRPCLPGRLGIGHGHVELAPEALVEDLARLAEAVEGSREAEADPLLLIGRRQLRNNNSWMHNLPRLAKGPARCTLLVHPGDALRLGLEDGALARVASRVGEIQAPVQVSDEIMPGVVSLPHGFGQGDGSMRLSVAGERPGVSVNDLTDERLVDALSGNAAFNGVPVRVEPA